MSGLARWGWVRVEGHRIMSFVALATDRFAEAVDFYGRVLGFPALSGWDRPGGRAQRFDLGGGLRLELLDNAREARPLRLTEPGDRVHLVVEVANLAATRERLRCPTPEPVATSWGAFLVRVVDPDGVAVTFLQWASERETARETSHETATDPGAGGVSCR